MKLKVLDGRITINADDLAPLLDLTNAEFRERMRDGRIATLSESGEGEDAGRLRVTFQDERWKVRLICARDGTVLQRLRLPVGRG
ncbi:hypothetical protein SAMN05444004_107126 [Jannaschia faecimaris]|uniref:Uncharacterized protein n=1 Tax=Jannaschia faecimaris TaxID=1244108 RepID=A0A1H3R212_9RHOB|nr:DUF6522 family protein [Jannaschia faecimaris]SDZ19872.1 hypothetical protein SAMN05444004_107126 [Jannaschia faecimaris]